MKTKEFVLNLRPEENRYYAVGLLYSPFPGRDSKSPEEEPEEALGLGIPKDKVGEYLDRMQLSDEVCSKIVDRVQQGRKYRVRIAWNEQTQSGELAIKEI